MTIKVISNKVEREVFTDGCKDLLSILQNNGYEISAGCGGNGKCNKCKVFLIEGDTRREVSACKTPVVDGMVVEVPSSSGIGLSSDLDKNIDTDGEDGVGVAIDIGTTTVVMYFVYLKTGKTVEVKSFLNPQRTFGADVISRISYATENGVERLETSLKERINCEISHFKEKFNFKEIKKTVVTGNTVMLHIFLKEDISSFGYYPFTPVFLNTQIKRGEEVCIDSNLVVVLPSFSSFVGADLVCGAVAVDLLKSNSLLVDLGTNGEMLLYYNGKLLSTSVAAGPAFEGADIECGIGGVEGAINKVYIKDGKIAYETIGGKEPIGICGSGLIDAISCMLNDGIIDETGAFLCDTDRFYISDSVYITSSDVRKFQLAKSAVRSGIEVLLENLNLGKLDIDNLYISGGLGYYINITNAVKLGVIPKELESKVIISGNTAGIGAKMCLLSKSVLKTAEEISVTATNVDLSSNPMFTDQFMENMFF